MIQRKAITAAGACLVACGLMAMGPTILREDGNEHRESLDQLEASMMPIEAIASLTDWSQDDPMTAESIKGKVVLITTITGDDSQSQMTISMLTRMNRKLAEKGLVVLAVHPEDGWDAMMADAMINGTKVQIAKDAGGVFSEMMHPNDSTDTYIIDRAGQLRYADIANRSIASAVDLLLREDEKIAIANAEREAQGLAVLDPDLPLIEPIAYDEASWPSVNMGEIKALNYQNQQLPVPMGNEKWLSKRVELKGKVLVLDFWATWCGPCRKAMPALSKLQDEFADELVIIGMGGQSDDIKDVKKFIRTHDESYTQMYDKDQTVYRAMKVTAIPHVVIISTDGVIRWQGNPLSQSFAPTLKQVIAVDPMIQAIKNIED